MGDTVCLEREEPTVPTIFIPILSVLVGGGLATATVLGVSSVQGRGPSGDGANGSGGSSSIVNYGSSE